MSNIAIDWSKYMQGLQGKANGKFAVIETGSTPNGSWYRKWSDGWVEQGGYIGKRTNMVETVNFPVPFITAGYYSSVSPVSADTGAVYRQSTISGYTTTSMAWIITEGANRGLAPFYWYACGKGA